MGKYGCVAVNAANLAAQGNAISPRVAWETAVLDEFPNSKSSRDKSCPKGTFLTLCEIGAIKDVKAGINGKRSPERRNLTKCLYDALMKDRSLRDRKSELWSEACQGKKMTQNNEIDVLIALYENKSLVGT